MELCDFTHFPVILVVLLGNAEIPRRTHRPRTTCPDDEKPKELHRFWRGESAPGSPKSAHIIPKPQFSHFGWFFSGISAEIEKFGNFKHFSLKWGTLAARC